MHNQTEGKGEVGAGKRGQHRGDSRDAGRRASLLFGNQQPGEFGGAGSQEINRNPAFRFVAFDHRCHRFVGKSPGPIDQDSFRLGTGAGKHEAVLC